MKTYQTIILSGGGSKGAFGLGALLALEKYHRERNKNNITKIYCGTSVGALNATLAAQGDLDELSNLYANTQTRDILGTNNYQVNLWDLAWSLLRRPYYYFRNDALKFTIERYAKYERLENANLLICVTNYSTGNLETFYVSDIIDEFIKKDQEQPSDKQRLHNFYKIDSQDLLVKALLASTAIPFYFPPIKINNSMYVDGGVGNNTPLRQAAYICRFLSATSDAQLEPTICVVNDPVRFKIENTESNDLFGVIHRTMNIFNNALFCDSHLSWDRINKEIQHSEEMESILNSQIDAQGGLSDEEKGKIMNQVGTLIRPPGTATPRQQLPLITIRPHTPLTESILKFDPKVAKTNKEHGVEAFLSTLHIGKFITQNDMQKWSSEI